MILKKLLASLVVAVAAFSLSAPGQAAMVGTAQLQPQSIAAELASVEVMRDWLREQLVNGGVEASAASQRVAAMTDTQVSEIFQRFDDVPAGAGLGEVLIVALIVFLVLEVTGYTDFIPD